MPRLFQFVVLIAFAGFCGLGLLPAEAQPMRLRGIVTALSGVTLYIKENDGGLHEVKLDGTKVFAMVPATAADIKPDDFVGIVSVPDKDGLRAVAINIFPTASRGLQEGRTAWDSMPNSQMTNAYVTAQATGVAGSTLTIKYKGETGEIMVTPQTKVVTMGPSDLRELSPGVHVLVFALKGPDGTLKAGALIAGHAGLIPPL